ncbi:MAG: sigma-70 family RNA polymerase sigma factor [Marmoricola sp.]
MDIHDDVVREAASGDQIAFRELYDALAPKVLGYLRARGVDDPEGLTNEVFLAVYPRLRSLTGGATGLRTLVFSVAHARVVDEARRRARRPVSFSYDPEYDERTIDSAEQVAVISLEAERALELMKQLNDDQRTVVTLRIIGDLTLVQTAAVTGKTVASVKQLQRRGLSRLRSLMVSQEVLG